jgi:hypothetical protein
MLRDTPDVRVEDVSRELGTTNDATRTLLQQARARLEDNPSVLDKAFRGFPVLTFKPMSVHISSTTNLDRTLQYANVLRYILGNTDSAEIDAVCPKRMEEVPRVEVHVEEAFDPDFAEFALEEKDEPEPEPDAPAQVQKIVVPDKKRTAYKYFSDRLEKFDPDTYNSKHPNYEYPKKCEQKHQPLIMSDNEIAKAGEYDPRKYPAKEQLAVEGGIAVCPEFWCPRDEIPLRADQLVDEICPKCGGKVLPRTADFKYPKFTNYLSPTNGKPTICCFSSDRAIIAKAEDKYYILRADKPDIPELRLAYIPTPVLAMLELEETYASFSASRFVKPLSGYFRVGIGRPSKSVPVLLGLKTAVPRPRDKPNFVIQCSFFSAWRTLADGDTPIARRIAGIDNAFQTGELTMLQELEYTLLALQCDVFRLDDAGVHCFFPLRMFAKKRAFVMLQDTILAHVSRSGNTLEYSCNVYDTHFPAHMRTRLEERRTKACHTAVPSYDTALKDMNILGESEYSIVLDPYQRGQALYVPGRVILPFQAAALPNTSAPKVAGFEDVELPSYSAMREALAKLKTPGYAWAEDISNVRGQRVEIQLQSGLRIPVQPEDMEGPAKDVIVPDENELAFGELDRSVYRNISYTAEIFEFLMYELSKTLDEYPDLRLALENQEGVEPLLRAWFKERTHFVDITDPAVFLTKMRTSCGQFKTETTCKGVCGWNGSCKIKVANFIQKEPMFRRLLTTMLENRKLRAVVLDGRVTPFFSTILYMELPHELILTDTDLHVL